MKFKFSILIVLFFGFTNSLFSQELTASTLKLGPFSLDMKNTDVDKICGKKITVIELKKASEDYEKALVVTVNGVKYSLDFYKNTDGDGKEDGTFTLTKIKCSDSKMKTKSGIAIGMEKFAVLKKLDEMNVGFEFYKNLNYDNDGKPTNKFYEYIKIYDTKAGKTLTLNLEDGKVKSFELYYDEGC